MTHRCAATIAGALLILVAGSSAAQEKTSCTSCHGDPDWFGEESVSIVEAVREGAHGEVGLSCHDCHGGNPDLELAEDPEAAMDEAYEPNPYRGVTVATEIPDLCGSCHSDADYMKRFRPDIRVDQVQEYRTSHHGRALAEGDTDVATCVDCHGVHGILGPGDPDSPVYPTRIAETCRSCHGDPEYMAGYETPDGRPLPTDQYGAWRRSVHARGLLEEGDLSAPTCNDCHGNHGATPPGVDSVAFVCGQCHGREARLFRGSSKAEGFQEHNDFLQAAESCADCHVDPQASVTGVAHFTECATCHGNHAIVEPTVTMVSPVPPIPCAFCHEPVGGAVPVPEPERVERHYEEVKRDLLARAREDGLEGDALFDHLVHEARALEFHTRPGEEGERVLRPEFERLYRKFRLGTTHFTYEVRGEEQRRKVIGCADCHGPEPDMVDEAVGFETSERMMQMLREVTAWTARAERIALRARRGGVETGEVDEAIDRAVDAQIELQVLVHSFETGEGTELASRHAEGVESAKEALEAGEAALQELRFRRKGLAASLVVILALLIALGLKIRQLSGAESSATGES